MSYNDNTLSSTGESINLHLTGLIKCTSCGKNYRIKTERGKTRFVCSGYQNYGKEFCSRFQLELEDLEYTIAKHLAIMGIQIQSELSTYIQRINVDTKNEAYTIHYNDGTESIISPNRLKY